MWRANTDTPKKQTRQITEESRLDADRAFLKKRYKVGRRQTGSEGAFSEMKQRETHGS